MKTYAILGLPNSGKSTLFNELTKERQKIANYSGVTFEKKEALCFCEQESIYLIDLPGLTSSNPQNAEEKVTSYFLTRDKDRLSLLFALDVTHLRKSLALLLQFKKKGFQVVVVPTMLDLARKRGQILNFQSLEKELDCSVIYKEEIKKHLPLLWKKPEEKEELLDFEEAFKQALHLAQKMTLKPLENDQLTDSLDRFILHPFWGLMSLVMILFVFFQILFSWAKPFDEFIASIFEFFQKIILTSSLPYKEFFVEGILEGLKIIFAFLPYLAFLFFFLLFLEISGYLTRMTFLLSDLMKFLGLSGRSFIALLAGHACAIPAMLSTKTIEHPSQRLATLFIIPLTTCSARLPLYTLLIKTLVKNTFYQGLFLFLLYFISLFFSFLTAYLLKIFFKKKKILLHSIIEFPTYQWPKIQFLFKEVAYRLITFIKKVGPVIIISSAIIWFLSHYPESRENSFAAFIGKKIEFIFSPLGFDWRINTTLLASLSAREVIVSSLGTLFASDQYSLSEALLFTYPKSTLIALLFWFILAPLCLSTFVTFYKESKSFFWTFSLIFYSLLLSYLLAFLAKSFFVFF